MTQLMEYVRALEGRDNRTRGEVVLGALKALGVELTVQECRWPKIRNIIVDFSPDTEAKRLVFSAHYDTVKGSPGANDNASGVAVLLGLCHEIRHIRAPIRMLFFDREEAWLRTPVIRLGLLGSLYYVWKSVLRNITAIYNLEFCGHGDFLAVWPIKSDAANLPAVKEVEKAATQLGLPFKLAHIPWPLLASDHLSFRLRGISNSLSLSLLPASQIPVMEKFLEGISIPRLLRGRPPLPEPLSSQHTPEDTSPRLNENSLRLMLSLVLGIMDRLAPR